MTAKAALCATRFDEAAAQLAAAQRIVFTKLDRVSPGSILEHRQAVAGINPLAQVVADPDRSGAVAGAFAPMPAHRSGGAGDAGSMGPDRRGVAASASTS